MHPGTQFSKLVILELAGRTHSLKFARSYSPFHLADVWRLLSKPRYYQFTNGFTTQTATNDGTGSALVVFCWVCRTVKQRQAGFLKCKLRQCMPMLCEDSFQVSRNTDGAKSGCDTNHESVSRHPLREPPSYIRERCSFCIIGGQRAFPKANYSNKLKLRPRAGTLTTFIKHGSVLHAALVFSYAGRMNTWCNQRQNVPLCFRKHSRVITYSARESSPVTSTLGRRPSALRLLVLQPSMQGAARSTSNVERFRRESLGAETTLDRIPWISWVHLQR